MWYLIIPPIIVVVSLSFVLWYLSRKGADPLVVEKASQLVEEAKEQISFLRTKNFFLRILEKTAYRFKVASLKMHNKLNDLTQNLKARRSRFQEKVLAKKSLEQEKASKQERTVSHEGFLHHFAKHTKNWAGVGEQKKSVSVSNQASSITEVVLEKPIFRRPKSGEISEENRLNYVSRDPISQQSVPRPMVSETMTRPETVSERTQGGTSREDGLITRIAIDPKDFSAYEGLGDYYLEIGNINDAKECYRQVLKLSPAHRIVRIKIRRLEKILSEKA